MTKFNILIAILSCIILFGACTKSPHSPEPEPPDIWHTAVMSEIVSNNSSLQTDEFGEYEDYIKIRNPQDTTINIDGWGLSDRIDSVRYTFPGLTLIQPDSTLLVWCDGQPEQGIYHAGFGISADGEWVGLTDNEGNFVDSLTVPPLPPDSIFRRNYDL